MNKNTMVKKQLLLIPFFLLSVLSIIFAQKKPNIVFILADDAGYADFGFHGSKIMKTPHLDKLARQGMRCEQAYVTAAVCGPSRAGILTGKYQQRFGFEENNVPGYMSHSGTTGDDMGLPLDQKTMADHLKILGYRTTLIGKWHQGNADRFHPTKRGFDEFYGFRGGARSYYTFDDENPTKRSEDFLERDFKNFGETKKYMTDAFADEAVSFIEKNKEEPFFMFLSFNAVHTPMEADKKDLAVFPELKGKRQQLAAMTLSMDRACGKVLDKLKELGLDENTIVIFTNDNGGPSDTNASVNDPLSGTKANHLEGGIRVPFLIRWAGVIPENSTYKHPISMLDLLPTFLIAGGGNIENNGELDGVDLLPFLVGTKKERPHEVLYWKKENRAAIREGDWKLLRFPDRPAELYNLSNDISEVSNLAALHPEKVKDLFKKLFAWELKLERPQWQLLRKYEGAAMKRMDDYRKDKKSIETTVYLTKIDSVSQSSQIVSVQILKAHNKYFGYAAGEKNTTEAYSITENGVLGFLDQHQVSNNFGGTRALTNIKIEDENFLVLGNKADNALEVHKIKSSGNLEKINAVYDTDSTFIDEIVTIEKVQINDRIFIYAGGLDKGMSCFELKKNGNLIHIQSVKDHDSLFLHGIIGMSSLVIDENRFLITGAFFDGGLSCFQIMENGYLKNVSNIKDNKTLFLNGTFAVNSVQFGDENFLLVGHRHNVHYGSESDKEYYHGDGINVFKINAKGQMKLHTLLKDNEDHLLKGITRIEILKVNENKAFVFIGTRDDRGVQVCFFNKNGILKPIYKIDLGYSVYNGMTVEKINNKWYLMVGAYDKNILELYAINFD